MSKVRVALIGAGAMANQVHYPSLAEFDDVEMVAICDLIESKCVQTAERFGITKQFHDYRAMLDSMPSDAVYILMPPHHLYDIVIDCLRRRRHVFIEKPPAVTAFQTQSMAREAEAHKCITMVGFNRRHAPMLTEARQRAAAIGITQVGATFYKRASAVYYDGAVDVIGCDAIHAVDALRWLAGAEPVHVAAAVGQYGDVVPNAWNAVIAFENGCVGVLQTNWNTGDRVHKFEVHASGYSAYVELGVEIDEVEPGKRRRRGIAEFVEDPQDGKRTGGFLQQSRAFIDAIKRGTQPSSCFADAAKTMQLVEAIRRNDAVGCPGLSL